MNDYFEVIEHVLGKKLDTPVFIPINIEKWHEPDYKSIAAQHVEKIDTFPLIFVPLKAKPNTRTTEFQECLVTQEARADALPALELLYTEDDVTSFEHPLCTLSVNLLKGHIHYLRLEGSYSRTDIVQQNTDILQHFISGTKVYVQESLDKRTRELEEQQRQKIEQERKQHEHKSENTEQKQQHKEQERKEQKHTENKQRVEIPPKMAPVLPPSLQPTIMPFDADNVHVWLQHVRRVYEAYDIKDEALIRSIGQFLPKHLQIVHEKLINETWADYVKTLVDYTQTENTGMSVRLRMLQMTKKPSESTIDFILRVNAASAGDEGLQEKEKVKILLEIIPEEDAELVITMNCTIVKELIARLSDALQNAKLVRKRRTTTASTNALEEKIDQLQKMMLQTQAQVQATKPPDTTETKLIALLENLGKTKEKSLEEKLLEKVEQLAKGSTKDEPTQE